MYNDEWDPVMTPTLFGGFNTSLGTLALPDCRSHLYWVPRNESYFCAISSLYMYHPVYLSPKYRCLPTPPKTSPDKSLKESNGIAYRYSGLTYSAIRFSVGVRLHGFNLGIINDLGSSNPDWQLNDVPIHAIIFHGGLKRERFQHNHEWLLPKTAKQ